MSERGARLILLLLLASVAFLPVGAAQLNPTVKLLPRATAPVPAECEEGLAPQTAPRLPVAEAAEQPRETTRAQAPPGGDLRTLLREAQAAAETNNRDAFKQAVAAAKAMPGANNAAEVISVYDDMARLWDYQFDSPAGSFFDATSAGGALLSSMSKYRGYDDFIRRQVLTVDGTRIYPTRETREFLAREASQRLTRLGFPTPPRTKTPEPPRITTTPAPKPAAATVTPKPAPAPAPTTRRVVSKPKPQPQPTTAKPAPATTRRKSTAGLRPAVSPASSRPEASATAAETAAVQPGPSVIATPKTAPVATQTTRTETTAPPATETVSTATTAPTTTTSATTAQTKGRNIILPLMLILIGIGVLIVLFRASS